MKDWPADKIERRKVDDLIKNGRHSRLMELDPKYCDVIVKRWCEFTGKDATLEANGRSFSVLEKGLEADAS